MSDDYTRVASRTAAELFFHAMDMHPAVRPGFLARACAHTPSLKSDVESLLQSTSPWDRGATDDALLDETEADAIAAALHERLLNRLTVETSAVIVTVSPTRSSERLRRRVELIKLDQKLRWAARLARPLEAYLREWPELRTETQLLVELLETECLARAVYAAPATAGELQWRFPDHAGRVRLDAVEARARAAERNLSQHGPAPVTIVPERFQIMRQVGEGGMGVVYEAIDRERGARLALKTLPKLEPVPLYRFKREFRSLAGLTHPNLVSLYELISDGNIWFFTMEFVDGVDFISYCRRRKAVTAEPPSTDEESVTSASAACLPLNLSGVRNALRQLAEGVRALHLANIVHRDLKPSNVLVRDDGHVVILDFGVVKQMRSPEVVSDVPPSGALTARGHLWASWTNEQDVVGSVPYMSPEQAWRGDVTDASDWYAVGVMLYEALTGLLPFRGQPLEILLSKRSEDPVPPSELVEGIPEDLNDLCVALLRRDPQQRPSGADVLASVLPDSRRSPKRAATSRQAFVGRESQMHALTTAYEALKRNVAVTVHIRGRSGAGKTALARQFLARLPREAVVLCGRCYEQESVPYKALDSIVDDLCWRLLQSSRDEADRLIPPDIAALARIFPVMERVDAVREACRGRIDIPDVRELRRRAFGSLGEMLHRLGSRAPLVLFIDDLQWGDVDSAALLISFLEAPDPPRLMLIACYRTESAETNPCLVALNASRGRHGAFDVEVEHLPFADCVELATALLADSSDRAAFAVRIAKESGGSPYFVYELVRQIESGIESDPEGSPLAPDLDEALWRRALSLPLPARHLLEIVAAAGKPLPVRCACEATDLGLYAPSALAVLRAEHLIRSTGPALDDEIETYHDRIRESVTQHIRPAATSELHRRLALAFEAGKNADVEATAAHFRQADLPEKAAYYYALAGDRAAAALAFGRSAELYGLALQLGGDAGDRGRQLHRRRADAHANAGRGYEAGQEYQRAAAGSDPQQVIELQRLAGYQFCVSGHIDEGRRAFATVLAHYGLKLPRTRRDALLSLLVRRLQLRLRGLHFRERRASDVPPAELEQVDDLWSVATGMTIIDPIRGAEFQTRDLILALRAGEPYRIARALAWEAAHTAMVGVRLKARAHAQLAAAEALSDRLDVPHARGMVRMSSGVAAYFHGDFARCREDCEEAAAIFRNHCTGVSWELETCSAFALWPSYFAGEYADLRQRFWTLIAEIRERGARLAEADLTTFGGPFVWLAADDPDGAVRAMAGVMGEWSQEDFQVQHFMTLTAEAQIDLYRGDGPAAWQRVTRQWSGVADAMLLHVEIVRVYMKHLRARCALAALNCGDDRPELLRSATRDARALERERPPYAKALAKTIRAGLALRQGDTRAAADLLAASSGELEDLGWGCFGTAARRHLGELVGGAAGADIVARVDDSLRAQGVKRPEVLADLQLPGFARH